MGVAERAIAEIEDLAGQDVQRRNIGPLVAHVRGNLAAAAGSIARHPSPSIGIITGFYLLDGEPPNCETDGPPGAAMLGAGFASVGIPCRIATDLVNAKVLLPRRTRRIFPGGSRLMSSRCGSEAAMAERHWQTSKAPGWRAIRRSAM